MSPASVLRNARSILSDRARWCQRSYGNGFVEHTYCIAQALILAAGNRPLIAQPAERIIQDVLGLSQQELSLELWNDALGRTYDEIIDALDRAIARAEALA